MLIHIELTIWQPIPICLKAIMIGLTLSVQLSVWIWLKHLNALYVLQSKSFSPDFEQLQIYPVDTVFLFFSGQNWRCHTVPLEKEETNNLVDVQHHTYKSKELINKVGWWKWFYQSISKWIIDSQHIFIITHSN